MIQILEHALDVRSYFCKCVYYRFYGRVRTLESTGIQTYSGTRSLYNLDEDHKVGPRGINLLLLSTLSWLFLIITRTQKGFNIFPLCLIIETILNSNAIFIFRTLHFDTGGRSGCVVVFCWIFGVLLCRSPYSCYF